MKNTLLAAMGFEDHDLKTAVHDEIMLWIDSHAEQVAAHVLTQCAVVCVASRVMSKVWESPVLAGDRTIGFIDMYMQVEVDFETKENGINKATYGLLIEAKSKIASLGEVVRQIRAYQMGRPKIVDARRPCAYLSAIVCPDDRFASVLNSQSIAFIKSPSPAAPVVNQSGLF